MHNDTSIPDLTTQQALELASRHYGFSGEISPLPGERSQNFLIRDADNELRVLKIANAEEPSGILEAQIRALEHLAGRLPDGTVQQPCATEKGAAMMEIEGAGGSRHLAHLVTYLEGQPLAEIEHRSPDLLRSVGHLIASVDGALDAFDHPAARRDLVWDLRQATHQRSQVDQIPTLRRRALAARYLDDFERQVIPRLDDLPEGVIHNDGNDHNVMVRDAAGQPRATALIDFGDLVHSKRVFGLAISAAYAALGSRDPLEAIAAVVAGYDAARPLEEAELDVLFASIRARLAVSVTISARRKLERPEDAYVAVSERPAWDAMDRLAGVDSDLARQRLALACGRGGSDTESAGRSPEEIVDVRRRHLGPSLSLSYDQPLKIVRGWMQYLFDHQGRPFLDCVNNVCHVGHCHPRVVDAAHRQMQQLNTNTRYLHDHLADYAERLVATLPDPLSVCYFVCTGSEANDLALRLARAYTGQHGIAVVDGDYHGHTGCLIDISPYKHDGPGGAGTPPHVRKVRMPDTYRQRLPQGVDAGREYSAEVAEAIAWLERSGHGFAAFISESLLSCGGQIVPPEGYFEHAFQHTRAAGGVCILDEVQVGFGRVGSHFWAFESHDVVPDIVTVGKPIGNGHPLAAVITTPEIARAFANGMEYFNTFGGNPVSCAVGLAVLDVIEEEGLQARALEVGQGLLAGLERLRERHPIIGDVRGLGLFLGAELVRDPDTLEPAADEASRIVDRMKRRGYLLSTDGPLHNVIKIKPPLPFTRDNAEGLLRDLDHVLSEEL
ncbi:MAG: aminotransferase class III-fold pyridoxal phosphate-dependent enzyme [Acidobacteriota bacterium]